MNTSPQYPKQSVFSRLKHVGKEMVGFWKQSPRFQKYTKRIGIGISVFFVLILVIWFVFRGPIVRWAWNKATQKLANKNYTLSAEEVGFSGLFTVEIKKLSLDAPKPTEAEFTDSLGYFNDTLFNQVSKERLFACSNLKIGINLLKFWNIGLASFATDNLNIRLINLKNYSNYSGLSGSENNKENKKSDKKDPVVALFQSLEKWVGKSPNRVSMNNSEFSLWDTTGKSSVGIPKVEFNGDDIQIQVKATKTAKVKKSHLLPGRTSGKGKEDTTINKELAFQIVGELDKDDLTGEIEILPLSNDRKIVSIPLVLNGLGFKKGSFEVKKLQESDGEVVASLTGGFEGLQVNDGRISDTLVVIDTASGHFDIALQSNRFELDSSSYFQLNQIKANVFAQWVNGKHPLYALGIYMPELRASSFFSSLPAGLFRNIGIPKATGSLAYRLKLELNDEHPEDVVLESGMWSSKDFKIIAWGDLDPGKINGPFEYAFYENGKEITRFKVGEGNSRFVPFESISPKLVTAVLKAEDPDFYHHQGFYIDAFRYSIAKNYKLKRFAQGGSTISMQLVKNVFLGRRKTIARKVEEILFTWLIEKQNAVSKRRMLEVYLNIIEWGPGIFGASEASQFYFGKHPSELNWGESAFLAGIIPRPKKVTWMLDSVGCVRSNWGKYKSLGKRIMARDSGSIDTMEFKVCILPSAFQKLKGNRRVKDTVITAELPETILPFVPKGFRRSSDLDDFD